VLRRVNTSSSSTALVDVFASPEKRAAVFVQHAALWTDVGSRFDVPTDPTSAAAISAAMMAPVGINAAAAVDSSASASNAPIAVLGHTLLDVPRAAGAGVDKLPVVIISDSLRLAGSPVWSTRSPMKALSPAAGAAAAPHASGERGRSGLVDSIKRKASGVLSIGGLFGGKDGASADAADPRDPRDNADLVTESDAEPLAQHPAPLAKAVAAAPAAPALTKQQTEVELDAAQQAAIASAATAAFFTRLTRPDAADVLARLRAFVREFVARVEQDVLPPPKRPAVVRRFVEGMTTRVRQHPHWADASDAEIAALPDALEKYATTKLYKLTFLPEHEKAENAKLSERIKALSWLEPRHLDLAPDVANDPRLAVAAQQLHKMDMYKPPRDKLICILNCFPAADHEILTNKGFWSLDQVERHLASTGGHFGDLLVAGYVQSSAQLVYETPRQLVVNGASTQRLVHFADRAAGVSVAVTPDHDMFVARGGAAFAKVRAAALAASGEDVTMLAVAAGGVRPAPVTFASAAASTWSRLSRAELRAVLEATFGTKRHVLVDDVGYRDDLVRAALHAGMTASVTRIDATSQWRVRLDSERHAREPTVAAASVQCAPYAGRTWCFEMPSGFVVARRVAGDSVSRPLVHGNCCKVLYTVAESAHRAGADELLPLLILAVIRANPPQLYSHTQHISLYRGSEGLLTEPGYYFTQLMSALAFLEQCDASLLTIAPDEFAARMSGRASGVVVSSAQPIPQPAAAAQNDLFASLLVPQSSGGSDFSLSSVQLPSVSRVSGDRFLDCDARSLQASDVAELLQSYRSLVAENAQLREQLSSQHNDLFDIASPTPPKRGQVPSLM
jgi:hypothetical protein